MTTKLFRRVAIESRRPHLFTELPTALGRTSAFVLWCCALAGASAILAALFIPFSGTVIVPAIVSPSLGLVDVKAPHGGYLAVINAAEGSQVNARDPLFTVDQSAFREDGDVSEASIEEQQQAFEATVVGGRSERQIAIASAVHAVREVETAVEQLLEERELQAQRQALLERQTANLAPLVERGFMSQVEYIRRQEMNLASQQQLIALDRQIGEQRARLRAARDALAEARARDLTAASEDAREMAAFRQRRAESAASYTSTPLAPVAGEVVRIHYELGEYVGSQSTVLTLARPEDALVIKTLVPIRWAGRLSVGDQVHLRVDGSLENRIDAGMGEIIQVSRVPVSPDPNAVPYPIREPSYRVTVAARSDRLRRMSIGQPISVAMGTERRSLFELLFNP